MTTAKDTQARRLAFVALLVGVGGFMLGSARADSVSEPDAAELTLQVSELQAQVDDLTIMVGANDALAARVGELEDSSAVIDCLAYSDFHYYKERIGAHGKRWRLPVMVWRADLPSCRPSAAAWTPGKRVRVVASPQAR